MAAIRTVIATLSPMFRDLIKDLMARHVQLDFVGEFDSRDRLKQKVRALAPDLILIGLVGNEEDEVGLSLTRLLPNARVIALSNDARDAFVYETRSRRIVLRDVSSQALIDAILGP